MFKTEAKIRLDAPKVDGPYFACNQPGTAEGKMPESYNHAITDSGLTDEYMRLQDDFMKWQEQLLQNQQLLHNRVAPIASNPPTLHNIGMMSNMMNSSSNPSSAGRKPVEINIPIRLVDSDEDDVSPNQVRTQPQFRQMNKIPEVSAPSNRGPSGGSVPVASWRERPNMRVQPQLVVYAQPTHPEPSSRPFDRETVFQSAPQGRQPQPNFQQMPPQSNFQQMPTQPNFQQMPPQSNFQQIPPQSNFQQIHPQSSFQQMPTQSYYQQMPPSDYQQMAPQSTYQQVPPQSNFQPPQSLQRMPPQSNYQQNFHQPEYSPGPQFNQVQPGYQQANHVEPQPVPQFPPGCLEPRHQDVSKQVLGGDDDGLSARFSSVVTLGGDKDARPLPERSPPKDKVRSIVHLNSEAGPPAPTPAATRYSGATAAQPTSTRLVQQAMQQQQQQQQLPPAPRQSPPRMVDLRPSPARQDSAPALAKEPSPPPPPPFALPKLRHVERVSPPRISSETSVPDGAPAPPPPPPLPSRVPPPPPPPSMDEGRRTSTGKKIISSGSSPQELDAREELMMAIRNFGGSANLRRSPHPINYPTN